MNIPTGYQIASTFYTHLRREVIQDHAHLAPEDLSQLQAHYPVMLSPQRNPVELAATIYAQRRQYPVAAIRATAKPVVFDAGCGYGSESFLFASLGARVIAADIDAEKIRIARLRQSYYEELFQRKLVIDFHVVDLDNCMPNLQDVSLTWLASVLAALPHQERFLQRVFEATRVGGQIMISDMNLWNPLFLFGEWRRRERVKRAYPDSARDADFGAMLYRRGRVGARDWMSGNRIVLDDVQFFSPATLDRLLRQVGFRSMQFHFSGFVPPTLARVGLERLEAILARVPLLARLGYFYLGIGVK